MQPKALLDTTNNIRSRTVAQSRISVTDLARSTSWRKTLKKDRVVEVLDRGTQVGWLLSPDGMQALLDTMDYLETELERAQIAYLHAQRFQDENWLSGADLAESAANYLDANYETMQAALDDN